MRRARGASARALWSNLDSRSTRFRRAAVPIQGALLLTRVLALPARIRRAICERCGAEYATFCRTDVAARLALHTLVVLLVLLVTLGETWAAVSRLAVQPAQPTPHEVTASRQDATGDTLLYAAPLTTARPDDIPSAGGGTLPPPPGPMVMAPVIQDIPAFRDEPHVLAPDETLGSVATRYGVTPESLVWANGLTNGDVLAVGQQLRIPHISGLPHVIQPGETLDDIGARFDVPAEAIVAFPSNRLRLDGPPPVGREIYIPGGETALPQQVAQRTSAQGAAALAAQHAGVVRQQETNMREGPDTIYARVGQFAAGRRAALLGRHNDWLRVEIGGTIGWMHADMLDAAPDVLTALPESTDFPPPPPVWVWPARGAISSHFGPRWGGFHNGLDIANAAWTPIVAARAGWVSQAGWCSGYGYCVKINHGDGIQTVYGHLVDQPVVGASEEVAVGEVIGYMGSTYDAAGGGYSTGNHLHFEVRLHGRTVNPLTFLP